MDLTDESKSLQTFEYLLEIQFNSGALPSDCLETTYTVAVTAYLSELCPDIATALYLDGEPVDDNTIYMTYKYSEGDGSAQDRWVTMNPLNWISWQSMSNSDCDVY